MLNDNKVWTILKIITAARFLGIFVLLPPVGALPFPFTKVPPSKLYVSPGKTARFVWNYSITNKDTEFGSYSPTWYYSNNTQIQIAFDYKRSIPKWKFVVPPSCPETLRYRVSKESTATLVTSNVTTADNGKYQCTLYLTRGLIVTTKAQLIVKDKAVQFTLAPPSVVYVPSGGTAKLIWDYHVNDKIKDFGDDGSSPVWYFEIPRIMIAAESGLNGWKWTIVTSTCPPRLLNPTRVSKESTATLVITNVSTADNGIYGCALVLKGGSQINSPIRLVVGDVLPKFIKVPSSVMSVKAGDTVKLMWDYVIGNKSKTFDLQSPLWEINDRNSVWKAIGYDDGTSGWKWKLSSTCPSRLLDPTRVSKASTATLVIFNVSLEDSGIYRCNLTLKNGPPITSQVTLIFTVLPQFQLHQLPNIYIPEGKELSIYCSAIGHPSPNITWLHVQGVTKVIRSQGRGSASLSIPDIKRNQSGTYECQATNNPNERPAIENTTVIVMYTPYVDISLSDKTISSLMGISKRLRCVVHGIPSPVVTWYKPDGQEITSNITTFCSFSEMLLHIEEPRAFGKYKCRATNSLGYSEHTIDVVKSDRDIPYASKTDKLTCYNQTVIAVCISIIGILVLLNLIWIVFKCKSCRGSEYKRNVSTKDKSNAAGIEDTFIMANIATGPEINDIGTPTIIYDSVYEQPVDESDVQAPCTNNQSLPYEFPGGLASDDNRGIVLNVPASPGEYSYQQLDPLHTTVTHNPAAQEYQSLSNVMADGSSQQIQQPSNTYEPLKLNDAPTEYQELVYP